MATKLLISSILLSLFTLSTSHSTSTALRHASDILSNSGFLSMSLTLQIVSKYLTTTKPRHSPSSLTIFSPSDDAFVSSGQPSLFLLQLHLSPLSLSPHSLNSLPHNAKIPTLLPNHYLTVTSSTSKDPNVSLNGVKIQPSPMYDDGSLIIFSVGEFFNPSYLASNSSKTRHNVNLGCGCSSFNASTRSNAFGDVGEVLGSKGYSLMGAFLELQLLRFEQRKSNESNALTVFAPADDAMMGYTRRVGEYSSLLFRHAVACRVSWNDLVGFDDGGVVELKTFLEGYRIKVTRSADDLLMLNGVALSSPDVYYSDWLVVHGIRDVLAVPEREGKGEESIIAPSNTSDDDDDDSGEF